MVNEVVSIRKNQPAILFEKIDFIRDDSVLASFLFVAASEWWLRFLDQKQYLGGHELPLMRNGFRLVVFSFIIMIVVLFFRQGIMGTKELPDLFRKKKTAEGGTAK